MMRDEEPRQPRRQLAAADVERLADEIAEVSSHIDAATHRVLTLIRRFDEGGGWAVHGALSCAHWLNWRVGLDLGAARERVRVARALGALPVLDDALRRGAVSYSKVRAMTRVATGDNEPTLLDMARHATASQLERICRGFRRALAGLAERPESLAEEEDRRFVRVRDTHDGMVSVEARLRPDEAAVVLRALDAARRAAWRRSGRDGAQAHSGDAADVSAGTSAPHEPRPALARADALVAVAEAYLRSADSPSPDSPADAALGAAPSPVELVVHVDEAALLADGAAACVAGAPAEHHATLDDGTALPVATARRLACDAAVIRVAEDAAGNPRPLGRRTRRISAALRRALRVRDGACRFPGCTNRLTDAHHVVHWARGGATRLDNLCALCRRHHRLVHEEGYRIEIGRAGELRFFRRDGSAVPAAGPARAPLGDDDVLSRLSATHAAVGVHVDAQTAFPRWDGSRIDYDLVVQALVSRAASAAPPGDAYA